MYAVAGQLESQEGLKHMYMATAVYAVGAACLESQEGLKHVEYT